MLYKWLWRYFDDPAQLWCKVIKAKYKYSDSFTIQDLKIPARGGPWKKIRAAIVNHPNAKEIAINGTRKIVSDGANCLFWHDSCADKSPLKILFPRLFSISVEPNACVKSFGFWNGLNWEWLFSWKRVLRPQDLIEKENLCKLLENVCLAIEGQDKLIWEFNSSGKFTTKSFSFELDELCVAPHHDAIPRVWKGLVPHRIEIFVWTALLERINTRTKLTQLRIIEEGNDLCLLCNKLPESCNHLLLHCEFARQIWCWWINLWGVKWVFPMRLRSAFEQWSIPKKRQLLQESMACNLFHNCVVIMERAKFTHF